LLEEEEESLLVRLGVAEGEPAVVLLVLVLKKDDEVS